MRLLFIMETMRARGAERVASVLAARLASMHHEVFIVCTGFVRGEEFSLPSNVHLEFIPDMSGNRLRLLFYRIHFIRTRILEIHPDCILSLAASRTLFMITMAHLGSSVPMIFSERNDPARDPKTKPERFLRLFCFHACNKVVFQTVYARDYFPVSVVKKGIIIPNPVKDGLPPIWEGERKPYIAAFCKLVPQKNLSLLLQAFALIFEDYPELRLVIYGDGFLRPDLESEAQSLRIASRTVFHPHSQDVHRYISDCAMYVLSSDYEGQSNAMLEAMAMGLPCICTDCPCGGSRAVIRPGVNGLLVPVGDVNALADAMRYILDHPEEAERMGKQAARIREERKSEVIAEEWNTLIEQLVSR